MAFFTEVVKQVLLARNPKNIQMLTCFSLQNALNGLELLLREKFGDKASTSCIVLDCKTD